MKMKEEYKNWGDLNFDELMKVLEAFKNTEDRNESDKVNPREEDVKDYYEDNAENFNFAFCEHDGEIHCLGECFQTAVFFSCVTKRDTGETI